MNVTPFIDVLLVDTQPRSVRSVIDHTIMIEYTADRRLSINHQDVVLVDLEARLRDVYDRRGDKTLFIAVALFPLPSSLSPSSLSPLPSALCPLALSP